MRTYKAILISITCIICLSKIQANVINTDSIDHALKTLKDDTVKVNSLIQTAKTCLYTSPDKGFGYLQQAILLSKKINYPYGLAWAYFAKGTYYFYVTKERKVGIKYYQSADSIFHKYDGRRFKEGIGAVLCNYGASHHELGNYLEAIKSYIQASKILDSLNNKVFLSRAYSNLSSLYLNLQQYDKAEFYARQVIKIAKETNNLHYISLGNESLASALIAQEKYEDVLSYIINAKKIAETRNDYQVLSFCYSAMGQYYGYYKKDYAQAFINIKKGIEASKLIGDSYGEAKGEAFLGEIYISQGQFNEARIVALKAFELSHQFYYRDVEQSSLNVLAKTEAHFGKYGEAYNHLLKSTELKDSVYKDKNQRQINYLEALYQSEKKEKEINQLQSEKRISELTIKRRNVAIYALFTTIALLIGMSVLLYRNIRNKRTIIAQELEIERQKLKELEKAHQLDAAHAVLKGEEKERSRLSRDLHDGLGGMLSVVKSILTGMKGNYILNQENVSQFDHAVDLLDDSIKELRRVSHNMMPESLIKFGLKDALQDFCDRISVDKKSGVTYNYFGESKRVESSLEIAIYRIFQELVNNALKHANAKDILVQLVQEDTRIHLTVMDNGQGFDPSKVDTTKSSGLRNIRARVESLKGQIDIDSQPGKGTEIGVEFELI